MRKLLMSLFFVASMAMSLVPLGAPVAEANQRTLSGAVFCTGSVADAYHMRYDFQVNYSDPFYPTPWAAWGNITSKEANGCNAPSGAAKHFGQGACVDNYGASTGCDPAFDWVKVEMAVQRVVYGGSATCGYGEANNYGAPTGPNHASRQVVIWPGANAICAGNWPAGYTHVIAHFTAFNIWRKPNCPIPVGGYPPWCNPYDNGQESALFGHYPVEPDPVIQDRWVDYWI